MRILVTFALPAEFAAWRRRCRFSRVPRLPTSLDFGRCPMFQTRRGDAEILVVLTGIGPVRARRATRYALQSAPDVCISSGLAGAAKETYKRGEVLVASHVVETRGKQVFDCHLPLIERAVACGARLVDRFITSPSVVVSAAAKQALAVLGDAVEMESAGVLAAAHAANVPAAAIRVVSDDARQDLPIDFNRVLNGKGNVRPVRLLSSIAAEPASFRGLLQLAGESRRASATLADFLDQYIVNLAAQKERVLAAAAGADA